MRNLYIKEKLMQTSFGLIFLLFFQLSPVFSTEVFTQKDLLDIRTDAWALYNTAQSDRALKLLLNVPQECRNEEIYVIMANIYEDKGDTDKALDMLNHALAVNNKYYKAYYNFGTVYIKRKSWDLAIQNLELSIRHNKNFPYSYYNLGYCYLQLNDYKMAKKNFVKAISLKQDDKNFYQSLAYTYKMLGKEKDAKKVLDAYNKF